MTCEMIYNINFVQLLFVQYHNDGIETKLIMYTHRAMGWHWHSSICGLYGQ